MDVAKFEERTSAFGGANLPLCPRSLGPKAKLIKFSMLTVILSW